MGKRARGDYEKREKENDKWKWKDGSFGVVLGILKGKADEDQKREVEEKRKIEKKSYCDKTLINHLSE